MIKRIFSGLISAMFVAGLFAPLAACNTIEGAGKDIERGGKAVRDEAREQKSRM